MTRLRTAPLAIAAVLISAGAVAAFTVPSAASGGLATATEHSGRTEPAFPTSTDTTIAPAAGADAQPQADLPEAASHGSTVSVAAQADDATPDTNHGADVSAVAKQNGQAVATTHKPATVGKPDDAGAPFDGPPVDPGTPPSVVPPVTPGPPDGVGRP